jgi:DNA mismatch endonuclease (patch repair protein)
LGYRYRLHKQGLPGKPDLVFSRKKKAIFVHGCFWHAHQAEGCPISRSPKSNTDYWKKKFEKNRRRDEANIEKLEESGWRVLVLWECEIKQCRREEIERMIIDFLE